MMPAMAEHATSFKHSSSGHAKQGPAHFIMAHPFRREGASKRRDGYSSDGLGLVGWIASGQPYLSLRASLSIAHGGIYTPTEAIVPSVSPEAPLPRINRAGIAVGRHSLRFIAAQEHRTLGSQYVFQAQRLLCVFHPRSSRGGRALFDEAHTKKQKKKKKKKKKERNKKKKKKKKKKKNQHKNKKKKEKKKLARHAASRASAFGQDPPSLGSTSM